MIIEVINWADENEDSGILMSAADMPDPLPGWDAPSQPLSPTKLAVETKDWWEKEGRARAEADWLAMPVADRRAILRDLLAEIEARIIPGPDTLHWFDEYAEIAAQLAEIGW